MAEILVTEHSLPVRDACRAVGLSRTAWYRRPADSAVRDRAVIDALLACLGSDRSAYVRLAALHSLEGVIDARLPGTLTRLAMHDPDQGVQVLARRLLAQFASAG